MPYKIEKSGSGYKVAKKHGGKTFSKKPLTRKRAIAQLRAIEANTHGESYKGINLTNLIESVLDESIGLNDFEGGSPVPSTPGPFETGIKDGMTTKHPERKAAMEEKLKLPPTHWMHQYAKGWLQGFNTPRLNTKA